jgi:hypothetical protein
MLKITIDNLPLFDETDFPLLKHLIRAYFTGKYGKAADPQILIDPIDNNKRNVVILSESASEEDATYEALSESTAKELNRIVKDFLEEYACMTPDTGIKTNTNRIPIPQSPYDREMWDKIRDKLTYTDKDGQERPFKTYYTK